MFHYFIQLRHLIMVTNIHKTNTYKKCIAILNNQLQHNAITHINSSIAVKNPQALLDVA